LDNQTALIVNGEEISLRELLHGMRVRHGLQFVEEAVTDAIIRQAAADLPPVTDEELQQAADAFRRSAGLYEVAATEQWLKQNGLSLEDWEERLLGQLTYGKVRDHVASDQVESSFAANRTAFDRATVSQIVVAEEEVAAELVAQINEEGADFAALAREYSTDEATRVRGGYLGPVNRTGLGAEAEALVFGASPGQTVGPVKTEHGWLVLRVEEVTPGQLDDATREQIKDGLFWQWMQQQRQKASVETPVLEEI
jgi:putative peptide maturation system protein